MEKYNLEKYICLITKKELSKNEKNIFLNIVKNYGPEDIVGSVQIEGKNRVLLRSYNKKSNNFYYIIPLNRHISYKEFKNIYEACENFFDFRFKLIFSKLEHKIIKTKKSDWNEKVEKIDKKIYLSKKLHNNYVNKKIQKGWRYGIKYSKQKKTSPLLLPWEQLLGKYKEKFIKKSEEIFDILNDF